VMVKIPGTIEEGLRFLGLTREAAGLTNATGRVAWHGNIIEIVYFAKPIGKPRMTQRDKWAQRPAVMRYREWADGLRSLFCKPLPPADQVKSLSWTATFAPPASWSKKKRVAMMGMPHRNKADRDNIDKAILDALFKDDAGIASGHIEKVWGWENRLEILVELTP